jgi:hypothetical protein
MSKVDEKKNTNSIKDDNSGLVSGYMDIRKVPSGQ